MDQKIQIQETSSEIPKNQNHGHILVVASPLQGHAGPLMKLSHKITNFGAKITFLTMDSSRSESGNPRLRIISIPSGLKLENGWKDQEKLIERFHRVIPAYLEDMLKKSDQQFPNSFSDPISGVIIDSTVAWMLAMTKKMGFKSAVYWFSSAGCLALGFKIPHLIESQIVDNDGNPLKNESIKLLPNRPNMTITDLMWYFPSDKGLQKAMFHAIKGIMEQMRHADWILCNWFHDLDPSAMASIPNNILSIGPLLANEQSSGSFYSEDSTCLTWLDKQPKGSVIYVAFGSTSRFNQQQLDELAMGLELMGRPFLWVAWSGLTSEFSLPTYGKEFEGRVGDRGKMVEWAPQEAVLAHPSVGCFITHCGWNSFIESLSMGVPLLGWPYFGDQMYAQSCICDAWKVGLRLKLDESGIVSRHEIKQKVEEILSDGNIRENAFKWKRMARESIHKGASSFTNLEFLVNEMKPN